MRPERPGLVMVGGLNPTLANAAREGGERNGVMTALDDFIEGYDRPLRRVVVPIYFGLAIVADEALLAERPELGAELDRLESPEGTRQLLELSERIRLDGLIFQHDVYFDRQRSVDRAADRYLDSVKRGLHRRVLPRERAAALDSRLPRRPRHAARPQPAARSRTARRRGLPPPPRVPADGRPPTGRAVAGLGLRLVAARSGRPRSAARVPGHPAPRPRPRRPRRLRDRSRRRGHLPAGLPPGPGQARARAVGGQPVPGRRRRP